MKDEESKIILYCINCDEEVAHSVYYTGSYLRSVKCDRCGKKIEIDRRHLRAVFAEDFIDRILTKPHRMTEDAKKALAILVPFFPKRLIKEPLAVIKDICEILKRDNGRKQERRGKKIHKAKSKKENSS